jgi:hypothetical protein
MNKVLVGAALGLAVAAWSQPGLATQNGKEETCGDPYWDCCLSYYRGWGPGACGR